MKKMGGGVWKIYFLFKLFKSEWYLSYIILYMGCKILLSYYRNNVIEIDMVWFGNVVGF